MLLPPPVPPLLLEEGHDLGVVGLSGLGGLGPVEHLAVPKVVVLEKIALEGY